MNRKIITIIGGTGFLGRYVVTRLAKAGYALRVVGRHPTTAEHLKTAGDIGQIVLLPGDLARPESLAPHIEGAYGVINLVGVLFESGRQNFTNLHAQGAEKLALMAKEAGVERFIHISALGIEKAAESNYARTKLLGERAVLAAFPEATILRPSIMFGAEDNFYNQFAVMANFCPVMPVIGGGHTKFQPVYVDDVAAAIETCLEQLDVRGETFELGGPRAYTFREILEFIMQTTGKQRRLLALPFDVSTFMSFMAQYLPAPFRFTRDQVRLLKHDNTVSANAKNFMHLGIAPMAVEVIVPHYLARYSKKIAA